MCPMCGSTIELIDRNIRMSLDSSGSSCALNGSSSQTFYLCRANFDVCSANVAIYDQVKHLSDNYSHRIKGADNWREALIRYNYYVDFITDNQILKNKLLALANDQLMIEGDWSFLYPNKLL